MSEVYYIRGGEMSKVIEKWVREQEKLHGQYAGFVGFEEAITEGSETLQLAYEDLDIAHKLALFGFVVDLLEQEANS
jgi:hypothetical protein